MPLTSEDDRDGVAFHQPALTVHGNLYAPVEVDENLFVRVAMLVRTLAGRASDPEEVFAPWFAPSRRAAPPEGGIKLPMSMVSMRCSFRDRWPHTRKAVGRLALRPAGR